MNEPTTPKIFAFVNGGEGTDWQTVMAICEDGHCLAQHISSTREFAMADIGVTSVRKHELYKEHCPGGYELVWVVDPRHHEGLLAAYGKNQELAAKATT